MSPLTHHTLLSAKLHSLNLPQGWCTYILVCQDGSYYIGATENLPARILDHAEGKGGAHTKENLPVIFAWYEPHPNAESARQRERQLKGWSAPPSHNSPSADIRIFASRNPPAII